MEAFGLPEEKQIPQGAVTYVGVDTVDVITGATTHRNVKVAKPLKAEDISPHDIVGLLWTGDKPIAFSIIGHETAFRKDPYSDTVPPPAPKNVRVVQGEHGAYLAWKQGGTPDQRRDMAFYEVDAKHAGGEWGYEIYPVSVGITTRHSPLVMGKALHVRVRAEDTRGNRSVWVVCDDVLVDATPPPRPEGLNIKFHLGYIVVDWDADIIRDTPDLAGFELWEASSDAGADAVLVQKCGKGNTMTYHGPVGAMRYYNLRAFDQSSNFSDFAVDTWIKGVSFATTGVQVLTNADWERFNNGLDDPDWFYQSLTPSATVDYAVGYGRDGGMGMRCITDDDRGILMYWPLSYDAWQVTSKNTTHAVASVYMKTTVHPDRWSMLRSIFPTWNKEPDKISISPHAWFRSDSGPADMLGEFTHGVQDLGDDWYRVYSIYELDDDDLDHDWIGWRLWMFNLTGAQQTIYFDRPMVSYGNELKEWTPGIVNPGGGSARGLKIDVSGIESDHFKLHEDGLLQAALERKVGGTVDIGTSGNPFDTIYADAIMATTVYGAALTGSIWQNDGTNMYIDGVNAAADSELWISNSDGTYRMNLHVEGNIIGAEDFYAVNGEFGGNLDVGSGLDVTGDITVTGTVDGEDIAAWRGLYDTHIADVDAHQDLVSLDTNANTILSISDQALGLDTQTANYVWSGPVSGGAAVPAFRALVSDDIPTLSHDTKLSDVSADDHHNESHTMLTATPHTHSGGAEFDVFGLSAASTLAYLTPSYNPGANAKILRTDSIGALTLEELHAKAFIADIEQVHPSGMLVTPSMAVLAEEFAHTDSVVIVEDIPGWGNLAAFTSGDTLRMRVFDRSGGGLAVTSIWLTCGSRNSDPETTQQSWNVTVVSGTGTVPKGGVVLDYGTSGDGYWEVTVATADSPYSQIVTWETNPWTGGNLTVQTRLGNLDGTDLDPDIGQSGWGLYCTNAFLKGTLVAGGGTVIIDDDGVWIETDENYATKNAITWGDGTNDAAYFFLAESTSAVNLQTVVNPSTVSSSQNARVWTNILADSAKEASWELDVSASISYAIEQKMVSNSTGRTWWLQFDNSGVYGLYATPNYAAAGKGFYVGATGTDPGDNNLVVDGQIVQGAAHVGWEMSTDGDLYVAGKAAIITGIACGSSTDNPGTGNLWTTGDVRITGGLYVGSVGTNPDSDDIYYDGNLKSVKSPDTYDVYGLHKLDEPLTHSSFNATAKSDTGASVITNTGWADDVPANAKAVLLQIIARDSGSATTGGTIGFYAGPSSSYYDAVNCRLGGIADDEWHEVTGVCPIASGGHIYYSINASGTLTLDVTLKIWGYFI